MGGTDVSLVMYGILWQTNCKYLTLPRNMEPTSLIDRQNPDWPHTAADKSGPVPCGPTCQQELSVLWSCSSATRHLQPNNARTHLNNRFHCILGSLPTAL